MNIATAQTHLDQWLAADLAVSKGQQYSIEDRMLTRVHAAQITLKINYWSKVIAQLQRIANGQSRTGFSLVKFT